MKKNKNRDRAPELTVTGLVGAGLLATALNRADYLDRVDSNKIAIRGGTYAPKGTENASTVFNTQRRAWAKKFRDEGVKVEEIANYSMPDYKPGTYPLGIETDRPPIAELHVGARPKKTVFGILKDRVVNGKTQYRTFSDFGSGNQDTHRYIFGEKSWMKAPKGPWYDRNIVPGGDLVKAHKAAKDNINVTSIPVNEAFSKGVSVTPKNNTKKIFLSGGTGYVWPKILKGKDDLDVLTSALDKHYKEYELTILGGPNATGYNDMFAEAAKTNPKIKHIAKTDAEGVKKLFTGSDVALMVPGSITAELASIEGYKPKIVGLGAPKEPHFKTNMEWYDKAVGGGEFIDLEHDFNEEKLIDSFKKLDAKNAPTLKSIKMETDDIKKIMFAARKDLFKKRQFTRSLKSIGIGLLGSSALGLIGNKFMTKEAASKRERERERLELGAMATGAAALRGIESKLHDVQSRKYDFTTFDEVKNYYKDAKEGDIIFFKDSFSRGNGHPIVVLDAQGHYDWPDAEGWKKGLRAKKVDINAPKDPERPWRARGQIMEMYPGDTGVRVESLDGKLQELTHIVEPYIDEKGMKNNRWVFSRKNARQLGGIYRHPDLDVEKFRANVDIVKENLEANKYRYNPIKVDFNLAKGECGEGTCVTFANSLLENSKNSGSPKRVILPSKLLKNLNEVKGAKTPVYGKTNYISSLLAIDGLRRVHHGLKNDDTSQVFTGGIEAGTGVVTNLHKPTNSLINNVGGYIAQSTGGFLVGIPSRIKDKIKKINPELDSSSTGKLNRFLQRNPGVSKGVGALVLTAPVLYGVKKLYDKGESSIKHYIDKKEQK